MTQPSPMPGVNGRRLTALVLLVFLVAVAVYLPKVGNGFTFDDRVFIQKDTALRSLPTALAQFGTDQARLYRPLRSVIYAVAIGACGLDSPVPFHLAGIFFHGILAALVFGIVWLLFNDHRLALIAGLVFAMFGMMLGYGAWFAALLCDRDGKAWQLALAAVFLLLGCYASEEALMIWPLLLACFLVKAGDWRRRALILGGLLFVAFLYLAVRTMVLAGVGRTVEYAAGSLGNSMLTMAVIVWRYIALLFSPFGLSPAYGPTVYSSLSAAPLMGITGIVLLAGAAIKPSALT